MQTLQYTKWTCPQRFRSNIGGRRNISMAKPIEVEVKFKFNPNVEYPIIKKASFVKEKKFTDIYFDTNKYALTTKDIWLRQRDQDYECKIPILESNANIKTDRYREAVTSEEIQKFLLSIMPLPTTATTATSLKDKPMLQLFQQLGISSFATITTTRRKYLYDKFTIDLDWTDLGYCIGEVELMVEDEKQVEKASQQILQFCKDNQLQTDPPVQGKVLQYIQTRLPKHYQALVDAGLIARKVHKL